MGEIISLYIGLITDFLPLIIIAIPFFIVIKLIKNSLKKKYEIERYKAETERIKAEAMRDKAERDKD